jgi:hypothetical protein
VRSSDRAWRPGQVYWPGKANAIRGPHSSSGWRSPPWPYRQSFLEHQAKNDNERNEQMARMGRLNPSRPTDPSSGPALHRKGVSVAFEEDEQAALKESQCQRNGERKPFRSTIQCFHGDHDKNRADGFGTQEERGVAAVPVD